MEFEGVSIDVNAEPSTARLDAAAMRAERQRLTLLAASAPSPTSPSGSEMSRLNDAKSSGVGMPMPRWVPNSSPPSAARSLDSETEVPLPGSEELVSIYHPGAVTPATDADADHPTSNTALRRRCAELESEGFELRERLVEQEAALHSSNSRIAALEAELLAARNQARASAAPEVNARTPNQWASTKHVVPQSEWTLPLTRSAVEDPADELTPLSISPTTVNDDESLCGSCKASGDVLRGQAWSWPEESRSLLPMQTQYAEKENVDAPKWIANAFKAAESKQLPPPVPRLTKLEESSAGASLVESVTGVLNRMKPAEKPKDLSPDKGLRTFAAPVVISSNRTSVTPGDAIAPVDRASHEEPRDEIASVKPEDKTALEKSPHHVAMDSDAPASEDHCITDLDHLITDLDYTETEGATDFEDLHYSATDAECTEVEADDDMERMDYIDEAEDLEEEDQDGDDFFDEDEEEEDEYADSENSPREHRQSLGIPSRHSRRYHRHGAGVRSMTTVTEEDEDDDDQNPSSPGGDEDVEDYEDVYSDVLDNDDEELSPRDGLRPRPERIEVPVAISREHDKPERIEIPVATVVGSKNGGCEHPYKGDWHQISSSPTASPLRNDPSPTAHSGIQWSGAPVSTSPSSRQPASICTTANAITQRVASLGSLPPKTPPKTPPSQADLAIQSDNGLQRSYSAEARSGNGSTTPPAAYSLPSASPGRCPPMSPGTHGSLTTPRSVLLPTVAEIDPAQSPVSVRVVEARCPHNHTLTPYVCPSTDSTTTFKCDSCRQSQAPGSTVYGCRICNYDLCGTCKKQACATSPSHAAMSQTAQACQNWLASPPQASLLVTSQTRPTVGPTTSGYQQRSAPSVYTGGGGANPNEAPANAARMRLASAVVTPVKQRPEDVGRVVSFGIPYSNAVAGSSYAHVAKPMLQRPHA